MASISTENSIGRKLQEDFCSFCSEAAGMFAKFPFLKEVENDLSELQRSIIHPFNIAVFGRMKTGKSSLINALIGENLAITGVEEATATINVISHSDSPEKLNHFTVHWKDAPPETFPIQELQQHWCGKTPEVLEKIRRTSSIELYSPLEFLKLCEITDTPGTGSEVAEHEKVTQDFLDATSRQGRKADAVIYVFPPVGRESDMENLDTFRQNNCLPNSDPYNSVAVLHKWDHIFWENGGDWSDIQAKADRIYAAMKSLVAEVIPVSAPLAIASIKAPDEFFAGMCDLCKETSWEELKPFLSRDTKWCRDEKRKNILFMYSLPWATFQNIVREVALHPELQENIPELRKHLRQLSRIDDLFSLLDRNFFRHGEIIRQKQKFAEIYRIKKRAYDLIQGKLGDLERDINVWEKLFALSNISDSAVEAWIARKRSEAITEQSLLRQGYEQLDATFLNSSIPQLIKDEETLHWCDEMLEKNALFTKEQTQIIHKIFGSLAGAGKEYCDALVNDAEKLLAVSASLSNHHSRTIRDHASHIRNRIGEFLDSIQ